MIISIHQANYLPYPGFFHKLLNSDIFVIQDDIQPSKDTNRNKIMASTGPTWLTVPIQKNEITIPIKELKINNEIKWSKLHWKKISAVYNKSDYFYLYKEYLENIFNHEWKNIFDLNYELIKQVNKWLEIDIKIIRESELSPKGISTERLVNVCKKLDATTYLSGIGGKNYLDETLFVKNNITLKYQNYSPMNYKQIHSLKFIPNLSILDMLCNIGPNTLDLIKKSFK
jgi:hypothetical protein